MSDHGYEVFEDPYCYRGTFVLKNRAGLTDAKRLQAFELEMSSLRADEPLPNGRFGPAHYCAVHKHLFGDVYTWAGRYRTVRTAKGGNVFCYPEHIDKEMRKLFGRLHKGALRAPASPGDFVEVAADDQHAFIYRLSGNMTHRKCSPRKYTYSNSSITRGSCKTRYCTKTRHLNAAVGRWPGQHDNKP